MTEGSGSRPVEPFMTTPNEPWPSFSPQTSWSYGMASHSAIVQKSGEEVLLGVGWAELLEGEG